MAPLPASPLLRAASAVTLSLSLGALFACAPAPPAAPAAPAPAPSSAVPSTYGVSFVYEPQLTLRLQRDGQPYSGEAALTMPDNERQSGEQSALSFQEGQAPLSPEIIARFVHKQGLGLRVGDHILSIPTSGSTSPFVCAQSIEALQPPTACESLPPDEDLPLDHCDTAGQRAWQHARQQLAERASACWSSPDAPTLQRLARLDGSPLQSFACRHLIDALGPEPSDEQGIKLLPWCLSFFSNPTLTRLDHAHARRVLPDELAAAQRGTSAQMRKFYERYRTIAPEQAESVRKLAAERFGPPERARWFALRRVIEKQTLGGWQATLCEFRDGYAEVALRAPAVKHYSQRPSAEERSMLGVADIPMGYRQRGQARAKFEAKLVAIARAAGAREVSVLSTCNRGLHWYFMGVDK